MAWTPEFKERLELGGEPMFAVDFVSPDLFGGDYMVESRYVLHSHAIESGSEHIANAISSVSGTGQRISVRTWKSSIGGLRVGLSGANVARFVSMAIPRGMVAEFKVGFSGMAFDEFQTVGVYAYQGLSGSRDSWVMEMYDLFSVMQAPDSVTLSSQFYKGAGTQAALSIPWITTDGTMYSLSSLSDFEKDGSGSARGLLYCEPTDGDPFYVKFTGIAGTNISVVNANVLGTTRVNMEEGDKITAVGYVFDTVPDVAHMVLFGGLAGASTMPDDWHMNLNYSSHLVNRPDLNAWRSRYGAFYTEFNGDLVVSAPMENPYRGLEEFLSAFGSWLVFKEGGLSWRFVQRIAGTSTDGELDAAEYVITDHDIEREQTYQLFNRDARVEYFQVDFPHAIFNDGGKISTKPGAFRHPHPSKDRAFNDDTATSNASNALANLKGRLGPWYTRIPDEMSLTLKGWKFAELVPGDVVSLQSEYIMNLVDSLIIFIGGSGSVYHSDTQYMVTGVDVDWAGFTTSVQLSKPPASARRF